MKVLDIIKPVCAYLGLYQDYLTYFEPSISSKEEETLPNQVAINEINPLNVNDSNIPKEKQEILSSLILAINNTQEKILKTISLVTEEKVLIKDNKIEFSNFSKKLNRVLSIISNNKKLKYKIFDNYIKLTDTIDFNEPLLIKYSYFLPFIENLEDEINLDNIIKLKTMALGVASEYCFISGLFDDAEIWNKKFLNELNEDSKNIKNFITPKRNWR